MSIPQAYLNEIISQLNALQDDLKVARDDIEKKIQSEKEKKSGKGEDKETNISFSKTLIQPMTRLRKDEHSAVVAEENPEVQKIVDRVSDIFG